MIAEQVALVLFVGGMVDFWLVMRRIDFVSFYWKTEHIEIVLMLGLPLLLAGAAIALARDLTVLFSFVPSVSFVLSIFFGYVLGVPVVAGFLMALATRQGIETFGAEHPKRYLLRIRSIDFFKYLAFVVVLILYAIDVTPAINSRFNLFPNDWASFLVTLSALYSMTLVVSIIPVLYSYLPPITLARLSLLTELDDDPKPSLVDSALDYFNRSLRRSKLQIRIKHDISLKAHFLFYVVHKDQRCAEIVTLFDALAVPDPKVFIEKVSRFLNTTTDMILERDRLLTTNNVITIVGLVSALYGFLPLLTSFVALIQKLLGAA